MKNRLSPRHLRVAFCAMLVVLVAGLVVAPAGMAKAKSTATGLSPIPTA